MNHIRQTITGILLVLNSVFLTVTAVQLQAYASIGASLIAIISGLFAIRYYAIKSKKENL